MRTFLTPVTQCYIIHSLSNFRKQFFGETYSVKYFHVSDNYLENHAGFIKTV